MINAHLLAERFRDALAAASPAIDRKAVIPALGGYLVEAERDELRVTATDLGVGVRVTLGATVESHGAVVLEASTIGEWVGRVSDGDMSIKTVPAGSEQTRIEITAGPNRLQLNQLAPKDYPMLPRWDDAQVVASIDAENLAVALKRVLISVAAPSRVSSRPVLEAVLLRIHPDKLELASADGFRISLVELAGQYPVKDPQGFLLPSGSVKALVRLIDHEKPTMIDFRSIGSHQVMARFGPIEWVSALIDGAFPGIQAIIPVTSPETHHEVRVSADRLTAALAPLVGLSRANNDVIETDLLDVTDQTDQLEPARIRLTANSAERGSGESWVDVTTTFSTGENVSRGFLIDHRFLSEFLGTVRGQEFDLWMSGANKPLLFRPVNSTPDNRYEHVVMPMTRN